MSKPDIGIGRVVISTAGRDAGRAFIVIAPIDADHVAVADGRLRKVDRPKKKKIKHLRAKPELVSTILEKLNGGKRVSDSEIRNCLLSLGYEPNRATVQSDEKEA